MSNFKEGDKVVLVRPDEHDLNIRGLLGGVTGIVDHVRTGGWTYVRMDLSDKLYGFGMEQLELHSTESDSKAPSATKLRPEFVQFAMELVRRGRDVEDAIDTARKLQEASE